MPGSNFLEVEVVRAVNTSHTLRLLLSDGKASLSAGDSSREGRIAAMRMFVGLDFGLEQTAV
jgi:hypothetical protein